MDPTFLACEAAWLDGGGGRWDDEETEDEEETTPLKGETDGNDRPSND